MYTALARRCTRSVHAVDGRVHGTYNAVYTGRKDGRAHGTRPCTRRVHGRDRVTTDHVRGPCTAVCTVCTRPWATVYTGRKHGRTRAMHMVRPCSEHGRVRSRYVAKHGRVRGHVRTVYMAVHGPCTRPSTRPSLRPVYLAVYRVHARVCGLCIRPSTALYRLRTGHVHGPSMIRTRRWPPHDRVYSPCRIHGRSRRVRNV